MSILSTRQQIGKTLKNASRLRTIVGVFARHGFHNVLERIKLGRFLLERLSHEDNVDVLSMPVRIRKSFEELGPTFVKLGQLLATRPDLVPETFVIEFSKLHDQVQSLPFSVVEQVLIDELGPTYLDHFEKIEQTCIGSASIAQVHKAWLKDGKEVVLKIQRPGIIQTINDDLHVLYFLAELLEQYIPESRNLNPVAIVDEYFKTLELETNFVIEANNIRRFITNFQNDPDVKIPEVHFNLTTERVLTMESLQGIALSQESALKMPGVNYSEVIRIGLKTYMKMVFADGIFHGDLHAGNFFVMPNGQIGLIDFGVVGRLNKKTQTSIANMLVSLSQEDYDRFAYEYIDLAPFNENTNIDLFARDLRNLIAPYYGLTLKNVNLGKILLSSSSIAAKHQVSVPTELMLFFKSLVSIESIGRRIHPDFDFLNYAIEFASELVKHQYNPDKMMSEFFTLARESKSLINSLPRQMNFLFRKINSPDHAFKLQINEMSDLRKSIELSYNLLFLGLLIAGLLISSAVIYVHESGSQTAGMPTLSFAGFMLSLLLSMVAFFNYIKK